MIKQIFKATITIFAINVLTYCVYLILRIFDFIYYYELAEDYEENLPIFILFFIVPLILSFLLHLFIKSDKIYLITFIIEIFILGVFSIIFSYEILNTNCCGIFTILKYIQIRIFQNTDEASILLKCVSPILSAFLYYSSIKIGNSLSSCFEDSCTTRDCH